MKKSTLRLCVLGMCVSLLVVVSCAGKATTVEVTMTAMADAAKRNDFDRFIDCLDLEYFRNIALASKPPDVQVPDRIMDSLVRHSIELSPNFTVLMNIFRNSQITVLDQKQIADDTKQLTIRILPNPGTNVRSEDKTYLIFVRRGGSWKLSVDKTISLISKQ
jgi:hypothetical protein